MLFAPVAQWIEHWPPEPGALVRFQSGVFLNNPLQTCRGLFFCVRGSILLSNTAFFYISTVFYFCLILYELSDNNKNVKKYLLYFAHPAVALDKNSQVSFALDVPSGSMETCFISVHPNAEF